MHGFLTAWGWCPSPPHCSGVNCIMLLQIFTVRLGEPKSISYESLACTNSYVNIEKQ